MRKIRLTQVTEKKGEYSVFLGDSHKYKFSSKRKANAFLGKVNKFLNEQLFDLNHMYGELYGIYREYFLIIENPHFLRTLKTNFEVVEKCIDMSVERCQWSNGNAFTFSHLLNVYQHLLSACYTLRGVAGKSSHTPTIKKLDYLISNIETREKQFYKMEVENQEYNQVNINLKIA